MYITNVFLFCYFIRIYCLEVKSTPNLDIQMQKDTSSN